jgi:hypothetical protein
VVRSSACAVRKLANVVRFEAKATRGSVLGASLMLAFSFASAETESKAHVITHFEISNLD